MANILVVDDQPCVRELISEELAQEGHRVSSVSDAKLIWQHLTDSRPDLVLLDIYLDGCTRWDLLRDIKNRDPDLPVFIFTAYDGFAEDRAGMARPSRVAGKFLEVLGTKIEP